MNIHRCKITSISREQWGGPVYNLEVETQEVSRGKDDLFVVDGTGLLHHNCFPKDINAMIYKSKEVGIEPVVLEAAWKKNLEIRDDLDWFGIPGAVSETPGDE